MLCKPFDPYRPFRIWNPSNVPWLIGLDRYKPHARELLSCKYAEISKSYWEGVNLRAHMYRKRKQDAVLSSQVPWYR